MTNEQNIWGRTNDNQEIHFEKILFVESQRVIVHEKVNKNTIIVIPVNAKGKTKGDPFPVLMKQTSSA